MMDGHTVLWLEHKVLVQQCNSNKEIGSLSQLSTTQERERGGANPDPIPSIISHKQSDQISTQTFGSFKQKTKSKSDKYQPMIYPNIPQHFCVTAHGCHLLSERRIFLETRGSLRCWACDTAGGSGCRHTTQSSPLNHTVIIKNKNIMNLIEKESFI